MYKITSLLQDAQFNKRLRKLLSSLLGNSVNRVLNKCNGLSDEMIITQLQTLVPIPMNAYDKESNVRRATFRWSLIKAMLIKDAVRVTNYLDYGGGNGDNANTIGRQFLQLPKNKVHCIDVPEWSGHQNIPNDNITFGDPSTLVNFKDDSVDCITCFHVLHHIEASEQERVLQEFRRILKPNGLLIITEHDATSKLWSDLIDIEHLIFDVVKSKHIDYHDFTEEFYARYHTITEWLEKLKAAGFHDFEVTELHNKDNSFWLKGKGALAPFKPSRPSGPQVNKFL